MGDYGGSTYVQEGQSKEGNYSLLRSDSDGKLLELSHHSGGIYDKPLPFCGCGIGWFSFLVGFFFPLAWYYGTWLYFASYYKQDLRERSGLGACAIAALGFMVAAIILATIAFTTKL